MFNDELTLISKVPKLDKYRNTVYEETHTTVLCRVESITRAEFYNAGREGFTPANTFVIHAYEYDNQQMVEFRGKKHRVIRTWSNDFEEIELVCEVIKDEN